MLSALLSVVEIVVVIGLSAAVPYWLGYRRGQWMEQLKRERED